MSDDDFEEKFGTVANKFFATRRDALANTDYYLSMANDLDVYVATSMRNRQDFREMARFCANVFNNERLNNLHVDIAVL